MGAGRDQKKGSNPQAKEGLHVGHRRLPPLSSFSSALCWMVIVAGAYRVGGVYKGKEEKDG